MKGSIRKRKNNAWSYRIDLGFVDGNGKRFLETGEYYIQVKDQKVKIELTD